MHSILNRNLFFVREHVGIFKAANNYDILDPESQAIILNCREENMGFFTKFFRFTDYKRMTPFHIEIKTPSGEKVLTVKKKSVSFFVSEVHVFDELDQLVGSFKQQFFSIGGKFKIFDPNQVELCLLQGKWTSWDFKFIKDNVEFAHVSKQWGGLGKELFTSADNYMLKIDEKVPADNRLRLLIMGAVVCIDMVLKE